MPVIGLSKRGAGVTTAGRKTTSSRERGGEPALVAVEIVVERGDDVAAVGDRARRAVELENKARRELRGERAALDGGVRAGHGLGAETDLARAGTGLEVLPGIVVELGPRGARRRRAHLHVEARVRRVEVAQRHLARTHRRARAEGDHRVFVPIEALTTAEREPRPGGVVGRGRVAEHHHVALGEVIEDALVLEQAVREIEIGLAQLHRVLAPLVAALQAQIGLDSKAREHLDHDLGDGLLAEDPDVAAKARRHQARLQHDAHLGRAVLRDADGDRRDDAVDAPEIVAAAHEPQPRLAAHQDVGIEVGAGGLGEADLEAEGLRDRLVALHLARAERGSAEIDPVEQRVFLGHVAPRLFSCGRSSPSWRGWSRPRDRCSTP